MEVKILLLASELSERNYFHYKKCVIKHETFSTSHFENLSIC